VLARVITGIGVGADLAIVNTYVGEVAPRRDSEHARPVLRGDFALTDTGVNCAVRLVRPRSQDRRTARRSTS
jgi:MFS family permease